MVRECLLEQSCLASTCYKLLQHQMIRLLFLIKKHRICEANRANKEC